MFDQTLAEVRGSLFCGAKRRQGEEGATCRRPAGAGTDHVGYGRCKVHGGAFPSHSQSAAIVQARDTARLYGVPRSVHPLDGLMEEYYRTAGLVDAYEAVCIQLLPKDVVWGIQSVEESKDGEGESLAPPKIKSGVGVNIWVKLFNEERDRFSSLGERILKLDLAARQAELSQVHVASMVSVLLSPELGLSEDQRRAAARLLRSMSREQPAIEGEVVA